MSLCVISPHCIPPHLHLRHTYVPLDNESIIFQYKTFIEADYVRFAAVVIAFYEYMITFDQELNLVWRRKWTISTILFVIMRYMMLFIALWQGTPPTNGVSSVSPPIHAGRSSRRPSCHDSALTFIIVGFLPFIPTSVFSALRVYAVWDRNKWLALLVLALGTVPTALCIYDDALPWASVVYVNDAVEWSYCAKFTEKDATSLFYFSSFFAVSVADFIVVTVTWIKTYRHVREATRFGDTTITVSGTLLRDGSLYIIALFIMNLVQVIRLATHQPIGPVANFTDALQPILICRFLLNLRQADAGPGSTAMAHFSRFSVPGFRVPMSQSMLGNMGEPLEWRRSVDSIREVHRNTTETQRTERTDHADVEHIELEDLQTRNRSDNRKAEVEPLFLPS